MSNAATTWAWSQECDSSGQKLILLALADACGGDEDDPRICWPSAHRIATQTGVGLSTVRSHINKLCERGLLVKLQRRRRMNGTLGTWRYAVMFTSADTSALDVEPSADPPALVAPASADPSVHASADPPALDQCRPTGALEPSDLNHQMEPPPEEQRAADSVVGIVTFEQFWETYPKQVGKGEARLVWENKRTLTHQDRRDALDGARRHSALIMANPGVYVLPAADVWLRNRRWEDEEPRKPPTAAAPTNDWVARSKARRAALGGQT